MDTSVSRVGMGRKGDLKIFGDRLKRRREELFLSQTEVAVAAHMGLSNIQRLERNAISAMTRTSVPIIAAALRMTESEFMTRIAVPTDQQQDLLYRPSNALKAELVKQAALVGKTPAELLTEIIEAALHPPVQEQRRRKGA